MGVVEVRLEVVVGEVEVVVEEVLWLLAHWKMLKEVMEHFPLTMVELELVQGKQ